MISIFFFLFLLLIENLFLPALIGLRSFSIIPLFLTAYLLFGNNSKKRLIQLALFMLANEIFAGVAIGTFLIPFSAITLIYLWLNKYLNINAGLRESDSITTVLTGTVAMIIFFYAYSFLYIYLQSSYSLSESLNEFKTLFLTSILTISIWSVSFGLIFKYVFKTK